MSPDVEIVVEIGQEMVSKRRQELAELPEPEPGEIFLGEINDSKDPQT